MQSLKTKGRLVIVAVLVAAIAAAIYWYRTRPAPVKLVIAQQSAMTRELIFSGRVAAPVRVELGSTITGRVAEVRVREGDTVSPGDVLVRLESDEIEAQIRQAESALKIAQSRLTSQRELARPTSDASLATARATLEAAQRDARRTQDLFDRGYVSQARIDEAQRSVQIAQAQVDAARAGVAANAPAGPEAAQARLRIDEAQAALALAQARLSQTRITAPATGRIVQRRVDAGQIVQPGRLLLLFAQTGAIQLIGQADEKLLAELAIGQRADVVADAFPAQPFVARISAISPTIDAQRGTVEVKFIVETPPVFLREDMTLSVAVKVGSKERAITLPAGTVMGNGSQAQVRVIRDGRVTDLPIRLGLRTLERVEVLEGIREGDSVLAEPMAITPGSRVRAAQAPAKP